MSYKWREHNRQTFKDVDSLRVQLLASFRGFLFNWSRVWGLTLVTPSLCSLVFFSLVINFSFVLFFFIPCTCVVWGEDKMRWCLGSKEDFDIKSFYGLLRGSSSITFSLEKYLGCEGSTSCLFFVWTTTWGKVLTTNHLRKRGFTIMDC